MGSKRNIKVELEGNILKITAYLDKPLKYPVLTEDTLFKEYVAQIELPYVPDKNDIHVMYDESKSLLIIKLRRKRKTVPVGIE